MNNEIPATAPRVNETEALERVMTEAWHAATAVAEITDDWDTVAMLETWLKDNIEGWVAN